VYSTGERIIHNEPTYQQKVEMVYPKLEISSGKVKDLELKGINARFPMNIVVRVAGIEERDIGGDNKENFYLLEVEQAGVAAKATDDMTSDEVRSKIEEQIEEK